MLEANQDPYDYDLHGLPEYLEQLKRATSISAKHTSAMKDKTFKSADKLRKCNNGNGEAWSSNSSHSSNNQPFKKQKQIQCSICKKFHKGECFFKNKSKETETTLNTKTNGSKYRVKQYAHLMQSMMANAAAFQAKKKKKRKVSIQELKDSSDKDEQHFQVTKNEDSSSDSEETRSAMGTAMCDILGGMTLQNKKNA
jgi:hypothetical protein